MEDGDNMGGGGEGRKSRGHRGTTLYYLCVYILPKRHMLGAKLELHRLVFSS